MAQRVIDPREVDASQRYINLLSPMGQKRLQQSWQYLFRQVVLVEMPVQALAKRFHASMGRPTKELYSMAGLILIKEFMNWTDEQAVDAYMFNISIQYALNLSPGPQSLCQRTLERYQKLFREDELAGQIMQQVTCRLVDLLDLDVTKQRVDSTHVQSNMATFGRTRLLGVAIKGFLTQVQRLDSAVYLNLPVELRQRYEPSRNQLFGGWKKDDDWTAHRQEVASNMQRLIEKFAAQEAFNRLPAYRMMVEIFEQQCEVKDDKIELREAPGGNIIVNPSDPDATLDGHKGSGYQIQLCETCSQENEVQLIVSAVPEQAHQSDSAALPNVLADLENNELLPEELLGDTSYGSDDNYCRCEREGVKLIAPVPGKESEEKQSGSMLRETDFPIKARKVIDGNGKTHIHPFITSCPTGQMPHRSHYDYSSGKMEILNFPETCRQCSQRAKCPVRSAGGWMVVTIHAKPLRLSQRRLEQETEAFKAKYRQRSGIEATNSMLKRVTGLGRLRVRGKFSVFQSLLLKVAGWNILRAASSKKLMARLAAAFATIIRYIRMLLLDLASPSIESA